MKNIKHKTNNIMNKKVDKNSLLYVICSMFHKQSGFTLVELLVVIGIAALSMALLFPNFMGARIRARDSQRKREVRDIQKALELYKLDQDPPAYPTGGGLGSCSMCWSSDGSCGVAPGSNIYMHKVPCD